MSHAEKSPYNNFCVAQLKPSQTHEISFPPKPTGKFWLLPDFAVESRAPRPEQKHIDAMKETFGFIWEDLP